MSVLDKTAQTTTARRRDMPFLDGIRALAALWVVSCHIFIRDGGILGFHSAWQKLAFGWLDYGHLAVDVFIVLSGFCLALPYVDRTSAAIDYLRFVQKRARRILPPYYAAILFTLAAVLIGSMHGARQSAGLKVILIHVLLLQDTLQTNWMSNTPLWSVAAEWKIYFLFPVLILTFMRYGRWALLGLGALFAVVATLAYSPFYSIPSLIHTCPWYLLLFTFGVFGAFSAVGIHAIGRTQHWLATFIGLAALSLGVISLFPMGTEGEISPRFESGLIYIDILVGAASAAFLVYLAKIWETETKPSAVLKAFSWRPLALLGGFSYSLYLTHAVVLDFLYHFINRSAHRHGSFLTLVNVGIVAIAIGCAYVFYHFAERPFLNTIRKDNPR
jgi:peptidoglycan/LPS O-acetylase OafA/YrhL